MSEEVKAVEEKVVPERTSFEWSDYVMTLFHPDELLDGHPTVDGLRRVVEILYGEVSVRNSVLSSPSAEYCGATVECEITLHGECNNRYYTEVADVSAVNTDPPFNRYPVSTAATRAEARAYRKILRLRKIIAAEEKSLVAEGIVEQSFDEDKINAQQVMVLNQLGQRHNVDVFKYINSGAGKYNTVYEVSSAKAAAMISKLNDVVKNGFGPELAGYKSDWSKK